MKWIFARFIFYLNHSNMDINPQYRFDTFAEGESSRLAFAACRSIAERAEFHGNPLVLIGSTGLGKTHLLHSVANFLRAKNSALKMICTGATELGADCVVSCSLEIVFGTLEACTAPPSGDDAACRCASIKAPSTTATSNTATTLIQ